MSRDTACKQCLAYTAQAGQNILQRTVVQTNIRNWEL